MDPVLTASFDIEFLRPVTGGRVTARGEVVDEVGRRFLCRAEAHAEDGSRVAWGSGTFVRSRIPLGPDLGYS